MNQDLRYSLIVAFWFAFPLVLAVVLYLMTFLIPVVFPDNPYSD